MTWLFFNVLCPINWVEEKGIKRVYQELHGGCFGE